MAALQSDAVPLSAAALKVATLGILSSKEARNERPREAAVFATTHWSVVLAAKDGSHSQTSAALEKLYRIYWPPVHAFIRRQGHQPEDAQDLTACG